MRFLLSTVHRPFQYACEFATARIVNVYVLSASIVGIRNLTNRHRMSRLISTIYRQLELSPATSSMLLDSRYIHTSIVDWASIIRLLYKFPPQNDDSRTDSIRNGYSPACPFLHILHQHSVKFHDHNVKRIQQQQAQRLPQMKFAVQRK